MVKVDVPPGAAIDVVLRLSVTPAGWPLAVKATAESNPPIALAVMVEAPLLPCTTETEAGEAERAKVGDVAVGARASMRPIPFGLPQPVTRS